MCPAEITQTSRNELRGAVSAKVATVLMPSPLAAMPRRRRYKDRAVPASRGPCKRQWHPVLPGGDPNRTPAVPLLKLTYTHPVRELLFTPIARTDARSTGGGDENIDFSSGARDEPGGGGGLGATIHSQPGGRDH